jgi:uncharacterized protein (DUF433 family)
MGFYGLPELRTYLALTGTREDGESALRWLRTALNKVPHKARRADYSFSDLISLFVVRELHKRGMHFADIQRAEEWLRRLWKTDRPFVSSLIQTDGRNVLIEGEAIPAGAGGPVSGQADAADMSGQQVWIEAIKDRLAQVHYDEGDGVAEYWTPAEGVIVDPRIQFGEPVLAGTRMPTRVLAEVAEGRGLEAASRDMDVSLDAVRAAVAFERELARVAA